MRISRRGREKCGIGWGKSESSLRFFRKSSRLFELLGRDNAWNRHGQHLQSQINEDNEHLDQKTSLDDRYNDIVRLARNHQRHPTCSLMTDFCWAPQNRESDTIEL